MVVIGEDSDGEFDAGRILSAIFDRVEWANR